MVFPQSLLLFHRAASPLSSHSGVGGVDKATETKRPVLRDQSSALAGQTKGRTAAILFWEDRAADECLSIYMRRMTTGAKFGQRSAIRRDALLRMEFDWIARFQLHRPSPRFQRDAPRDRRIEATALSRRGRDKVIQPIHKNSLRASCAAE